MSWDVQRELAATGRHSGRLQCTVALCSPISGGSRSKAQCQASQPDRAILRRDRRGMPSHRTRTRCSCSSSGWGTHGVSVWVWPFGMGSPSPCSPVRVCSLVALRLAVAGRARISRRGWLVLGRAMAPDRAMRAGRWCSVQYPVGGGGGGQSNIGVIELSPTMSKGMGSWHRLSVFRTPYRLPPVVVLPWPGPC